MKWSSELVMIRRYLRDPTGKIWDLDLLREIWNEVQEDFTRKTRAIEDIRTISVPPRYHCSYTQDFEEGFATGSVHHYCLRRQQSFYAVCYVWEVQEQFGMESDTSDIGTTVTHPWESWAAALPAEPPRFPLPSNFGTAKATYYDREPLPRSTSREILGDVSFRSRTGEPISWQTDDTEHNEMWLYPLPTTIVWNDEAGEGMATSVSGDTTLSETGVITQRTGTVLSGEIGVATEVLEADDNILMVYDTLPSDVDSPGDEIELPQYLTKYLRFGVLEKAFMANTDGHIPSLAAYWRAKYALGIEAVKRFKVKRSKDRDYSLQPSRPSRRKLSRLPDGYPAL